MAADPYRVHYDLFDSNGYTIDSEPCQNRAKILMLHGHGQSGRFFYHKTRFLHAALKNELESAILKELIPPFPGGIEFLYPNGPLPAGDHHDGDTWAWGYGDFERDQVASLDQTIRSVMRLLDQQGPFIGIIGFSTGAAVAAIIASLLERRRPCQMFSIQAHHPPLRFVIGFSGFMLGHPAYRSLYDPPIQTPMMHFIAKLDTIIPEELTLQLAERCCRREIRYFGGTHYVPRGPDTTRDVTEFICRALAKEAEDNDIDI